MINKDEYLILRKALIILYDYLIHDDSEHYPDGAKEGYWKALANAEDILREFENNYEGTI
jgi:hypothetical protein